MAINPMSNKETVIKGENVSFTGKEAEKLFSVKELNEVYKLLAAGGKPIIDHITHNCTNTTLLDLFGVVDIGDTKSGYFGLPVYRRGWVPLGEIWMQDREGKVIRKFSLPIATDEPEKKV